MTSFSITASYSQALKSCRKKKAKGKKNIQKSLYGERDIASKKPLLSPIPELPEVSEMTPSAPGAGTMRSGILFFSCLGFILSTTLSPFSHSLCKEHTNKNSHFPSDFKNRCLCQSSDMCRLHSICSVPIGFIIDSRMNKVYATLRLLASAYFGTSGKHGS